jgi:hypothetical protein
MACQILEKWRSKGTVLTHPQHNHLTFFFHRSRVNTKHFTYFFFHRSGMNKESKNQKKQKVFHTWGSKSHARVTTEMVYNALLILTYSSTIHILMVTNFLLYIMDVAQGEWICSSQRWSVYHNTHKKKPQTEETIEVIVSILQPKVACFRYSMHWN